MVVCIMYMYKNAGYKWNVRAHVCTSHLLDQPREVQRANDVTGTIAFTFLSFILLLGLWTLYNSGAVWFHCSHFTRTTSLVLTDQRFAGRLNHKLHELSRFTDPVLRHVFLIPRSWWSSPDWNRHWCVCLNARFVDVTVSGYVNAPEESVKCFKWCE